MKKMSPQKQLLQFVMLSLLSVVSVLVMSGESFAALACNACHGTSGPADMRPLDEGTRNPATGGFVGSHRKHMASTATAPGDCAICHTNAAKTTTFTAGHRDGGIQMSGDANVVYSKGVFFNQTSVPTLGSCTTASCHASTTTPAYNKTTPVWGAASDCNSCHDTTPTTGAHTAHLTSSYHVPVCGDCHTGASASNGGANHLTGTISVAAGLGYPTSTPKHAVGSYTGSCSTTACHSSGQGTTALVATPVYAPVTWGGTVVCGTCHAITAMVTGRHANHILIYDDCGKCHTGASTTAYASTNHVNASIDVAAGLGYTAGGAPGNGYGTCSAASCHAPFTNLAPKVTRSWTAGGVACNACHESTQITGAHNKHYAVAAIGTNCDYCHTSSGDLTHADGFVNVNFIAAPIAKHASTDYSATCTTSCHSVYGAAGLSPSWGVVNAAPGCTACHLTAIPATGLHTKHLAATGNTCTDCHSAGYTISTVNPTDHANGTVQVVGQGYPTNVVKHAPGSGYSTCSTAKCHDAYGTTGVSASWNTITTSCSSCHAAVPVTGSHTAHLNHTSVPATTITCASCHVGATAGSNGGTKHIDGMVNVSTAGGGHLKSVAKHASGSGYMSCTATCHNGSGFTAPAVLWGNTWGPGVGELNCASCHGYPPDPTGSHNGVSAVNPGSCNSCHSEVKTDTTKSTPMASAFATPSLHMNSVVDGGNCDACHGYPPVESMSGKGINTNYSSAKLENYSGGGGAHSVAGHLALTLKSSNGNAFAGCVTCHPSNQHNGSSGTFAIAQVQVKVLDKYKFNNGTSITYNRTGAKTTGTCSNVSCHFQKTPPWSTEAFTQGH